MNFKTMVYVFLFLGVGMATTSTYAMKKGKKENKSFKSKEDDKFLDQLLARQVSDKKRLEEDKKKFLEVYPVLDMYFFDWVPDEKVLIGRLTKLKMLVKDLLDILTQVEESRLLVIERQKAQVNAFQGINNRRLQDLDAIAINEKIRKTKFHSYLFAYLKNPQAPWTYDSSYAREFLKAALQDDTVSKYGKEEASLILSIITVYDNMNALQLKSKNLDTNVEKLFKGLQDKNVQGNVSALLANQINELASSIEQMAQSEKFNKNFFSTIRSKYERIVRVLDSTINQMDLALKKSSKPLVSPQKQVLTEPVLIEKKVEKVIEPQPLSYAQVVTLPALKLVSISQLQKQPPIKSYLASTVMDWFKDPKKALEREQKIYPDSTSSSDQIEDVIQAHRFPFVIDMFIAELSYKFFSKDGAATYVIPGSLYAKKKQRETLGYYSWLVTKAGICVHRSFTKRDYNFGEDISDSSLYTREQIKEELLKEDAVTNYIVSEKEAIINNNRFISVTDDDGNVYKLLLKMTD